MVEAGATLSAAPKTALKMGVSMVSSPIDGCVGCTFVTAVGVPGAAASWCGAEPPIATGALVTVIPNLDS